MNSKYIRNIQTEVWKQSSHIASLKSLPWIIICFGIVLRSFQYIVNNSLWLDESLLALNIVNRSFLDLLKPLDYDQIVPIGFLLIEKLLVQSFGNSENVLRLFPFVCGIISIFLFFKIAKVTINKEAVIIALGLFSLSDYLIRYSSEVKQYSTDVAIALLLYAVTIYLQSDRMKYIHLALFAVIGAISIWISHPSVFILVGIGISLVSFCLVKKEWIKLYKLLIVYSIWLLSFAAFYFVSYIDNSTVIKSEQIQFSAYFMPFPSFSLSDIEWFVSTFFYIFIDPVGLSFRGIASLAFIIGCVSIFSKNKQWFFILLSPIFITLIVSGFQIYPFRGRLLLFIVPSVLLFIADGAEYIKAKSHNSSAMIGIIFIGLLFFHPILYTSYNLVKLNVNRTTKVEDIKPIMRYVKEHNMDGDVLYLYYASQFAFKYYSERYDFSSNEYIVGVQSRNNLENYIKQIDKLRGNKRVWILFSHVYPDKFQRRGVNEEDFFLNHLDNIGRKVDSFKSEGATVYLYDLSI